MTSEICDNYLAALKDPQVPSELLLKLLAKIEKQEPGLLQDFSDAPGLDHDGLNWTAEYFDLHMGAARYNFSRERIEHLISVREHLCELGVKGFVPAPSSSAAHTRSEPGMTANYTPSAHLQKFVAEGDLLTIRTALRMELNDNRLSSADLRVALGWVKAKVPGLFEGYQEQAFARGRESDQQLWGSQYYDGQIVYLKTNFSEERLLHLIEVRDWLRQQGVEGFAAVAPKQKPKQSERAGCTAQLQAGQSQHTGTSHDNPDRHPVLSAALMVGGALAILAVLLIALMR